MKFNIYEINKYCAGSDTDSIFITAEPLLIKKFGNDYKDKLSNQEIINEVKIISIKYEEKLNDFLNKKTQQILNVKNNKIQFKTETVIKSVYWSGKRRYAQHIVDKEGVTVDELDMKGLDIMKSNFPKLFRDFGEQLIKDILFDVPKQDIDKNILTFKNSLQNLPFTSLMKPTGLKKLEDYIDLPPQAGNVFSTLKNKCPQNTKAAIYTRDLMKFKKLDKKFQPPQVGDKIYTAYLKANPYRIEVIALNGYNDPIEITELVTKYLDVDKMFETIIKDKIQKIYTDIGWGSVIFNEKINKFFSF